MIIKIELVSDGGRKTEVLGEITVSNGRPAMAVLDYISTHRPGTPMASWENGGEGYHAYEVKK